MIGEKNSDAALTPRVGCVYRPQFAPERLAAAAAAADRAGLDELWLWEDCFLTGGLSTAAIALANSTRLTVGIGVLPVPMRNVAVTAMEVATLSRAFPGRLRVGVGHGVQDWMRQIGEKVDSPLSLLREYLTCLAALLRGDRVSFTSRYLHLDDVALDWPPTERIELFAGATGPRTLQLSGELADGTVIGGGTTPDALRAALEHIRVGGGLRPTAAPHAVVAYLPCTTGSDARARAMAELRHWGLDPADDLAAYGDAGEIAAAARRWVDAGADTIVLQAVADDDIEDFVTFVGAEVQPILHGATR
jgi:alkanesulfonate monooxygenase SsuD/methylene tetrahydromethanopterin reductase-like flavin-dependent oxidoreductase (luciferase family)